MFRIFGVVVGEFMHDVFRDFKLGMECVLF
jgi:hypothetical protein